MIEHLKFEQKLLFKIAQTIFQVATFNNEKVPRFHHHQGNWCSQHGEGDNPQSLFLTSNIFVEDLSDDPLQFGGKEGQLELQFLQQYVLIITLVVRIILLVMMIWW